MKKQLVKRILSVTLAASMAFLMMPTFVFTTHATNNPQYFDGDRYELYRLETINGAHASGLLDYIDIQFDSDSLGDTVTGKSATQTVLSNTKKWGKIISAGCKVLSVVPGVDLKVVGELAGSVGDIAGEFVEDNSTDVLMAQLKAMQQENNDALTILNNNLIILSDNQCEIIWGAVAELKDYEDLKAFKNILDEFFDGTTWEAGKLSNYYLNRNELYVQYSALLAAAQKNKAAIKENYDGLYKAAKGVSDMLYSKLTPSEFGTTIQEMLYKYYLLETREASQDDIKTYIERCIEYSRDFFATYELSQMCLNICYAYQAQYLMKDNQQFDNETKYDASYNDWDVDVFYTAEIYPFLKDSQSRMDRVTLEMAKYYARILNLDESFVYEPLIDIYKNNENHQLFTVQYEEILSKGAYNAIRYCNSTSQHECSPDSEACALYIRKNNTVEPGSTLYMNTMPDVFADIFDISLFDFKITEGKDVADVDAAGVVTVKGEGNFTVTMMYGGESVYSMEFTAANNPFSGGMGSASCPYLISTWDDIKTLADSEGYQNVTDIYFKLTQSINAENAVFSGILSFRGVFDGDGYSIYNFSLDAVDSSSGDEVVGFIRRNKGTIKNLTIGSTDTQCKIESIRTVSGTAKTYIGALVGINDATIENCKAVNVRVEGCINHLYLIYWTNPCTDAEIIMGGLVGLNLGKISICEVQQLELKGNAIAKTKSSGFIGGIAGSNWGSINDCIAKDTSFADGTLVSSKTAIMRAGGIVGYNASKTEGCIAYNISGQVGASGNSADSKSGGLIGDNYGSASNCYTNVQSLNAVGMGNAIAIPENQNSYASAENIATKSVSDEFELSNGYWTVSAYKRPDTNAVLGDSYRDNYICGESRFVKDSYDESGNLVSVTCDLQTHRIDTSEVGTYEVTVLHPIEGTNLYKKEMVSITVRPETAERLEIFSEPKKLEYTFGEDTKLDHSGLILIVIYDNGTSRQLKDDEYEVESTVDFSAAGAYEVKFTYDGLSTENIKAQVVCSAHTFSDWSKHDDAQHVRTCECSEAEYANHNWDAGVETTKPTHITAGELTKTCEDCGATIVESIDPTPGHTFGNWAKHDETQHIRACECGETEYANHNWDAGVETTKPTHITAGELTKTCEDCGATIVESIDPTAEHPFGDWTNHDDAQHVRTCICGETEYGDHAWDDGVETLRPTFTTPGQLTRTCSDCGATKVEFIDPMSGDLSCDGKITALDCAILNAYVQGTIEPTDIEIENYDFTGDGTIDDDDVKYLLDAILGRRS